MKRTGHGADVAIPLPWITLKGETGYFTTTTPGAQEYFLYVIQLERQVKEWSFVGGYAGEVVTARAGNPLSRAGNPGRQRSMRSARRAAECRVRRRDGL